MGIFTKVAEDAFEALQLDAGVLLTTFDPANPIEPSSAEIIATTTGGINVVCTPTYSDFGEDVDNVPLNMMEFKHLDSWECSMSFSSIKFNAENTVWSLGAATKTTSSGVDKIVPNRSVSLDDYADIWWVGDKADGGAYAVRLMNALSTGGMNIQSTKNGKGTNAITLTGHVSINNQTAMPMEFYDIPASGSANKAPVVQNLTNVTSNYSATNVTLGNSLSVTLSAASGMTLGTVKVTMGGVDITSEVYSAGSVSITKVTAGVIITATASA